MSLFDLIAGDPNPVQPNADPLGLDRVLMSQSAVPDAQVPQVQDTWKPTHRNILGRIADAMLIGHGQQPVYEKRMQQRDMESAMRDYDPGNPVPTIKRIAQIPGMADQAMKLYEQNDTDKERNQSRNIRDAAKKDLINQRIGGIAGIANEKNFPDARQLMIDTVKRWGENPDDYDIPDSYNKDKLDLLSGGTITAKDQQAQAAREQAITLRGQAIQNIEDYRKARLGQFDTQEAGRNTRFEEGEAGKNNRHDNPVARPRAAPYVGKIIKTPQGDMELSPSGLTGKIGDQIWQKTSGNQWTRAK